MSNYQDSSSDPHQGAPPPPPTGGGYSGSPDGAAHTGPTQSMPVQGAPAYQDPSQFGGSHQQQQWSGGPGASRVESHNSRKVSLTSALKTTEFWVLVVVSLGLLLAALVTDQGDDGQGFGSQDAWRYVTILAAAYMISRGLTKFGGREENHDDRGHR